MKPRHPLRDQLFERSMWVLLALAGLSGVMQLLFPAFRPEDSRTVPFLTLFLAAILLVRLGYGRLSAQAVILFSSALLIGATVVGGGATSRQATYLPMITIAAWSWLGRRAGLAAIGAVLAALALSPRAEGEEISSSILVFTHMMSAGFVAAFLGAVTRDLRAATHTAHAEAEAAEHAAEAAEAADAARDRFLAMVSHELRTPLDVVLGYAELLAEDQQDPDRTDDLARIRSAGRQLLSLLDDILDMSRVLNDDLATTVEAIPADALIEEVVQTIAPLAAAQSDRVSVQIARGLPPVVSDRRRIRQILLNLVSNAAKYTSNGEIRVGAELGEGGDEILFSVRDTGIGIPTERLHELFLPFVQLHDGPDRRPGLGLGLALSQRIAERLGGRIEASSRPGSGSTFTLRLPLDARGVGTGRPPYGEAWAGPPTPGSPISNEQQSATTTS